MEISGKRVLVVGVARSGLSAVKALYKLGAVVDVTDIKSAAQVASAVEAVDAYVHRWILNAYPSEVAGYDFAVVSPGVPMDSACVLALKRADVPVIGELELAYTLSEGGRFIAITGTNGKTTTTALVGAILREAGQPCEIVGNIGIPAVDKVLTAPEGTVFVTEVSSFQLESIHTFRPQIAAILNITPDHLDRHKTLEAYIAAKARVFEYQDAEAFLVINAEDETVVELCAQARAQIYAFSRTHTVARGAYVDGDDIVFRNNQAAAAVRICPVRDLKIPGTHNLENALAATAIAALSGICPEDIGNALMAFPGVEHRIERVASVEGVTFYNDSKATNPDSTICAIRAMSAPTHLILGGYEKGSDFAPLFEAFEDRIQSVTVIGDTGPRILSMARARSNVPVFEARTMEAAVSGAFHRARRGEVVLLSPACASWDMYDNFEQRGAHFKTCVSQLPVK